MHRYSARFLKPIHVFCVIGAIFLGAQSVLAGQTRDFESRIKKRIESLPCHTLGVTRTFLNISKENATWSVSEWRRRFSEFRTLGFSEIILEHSSTRSVALYESMMRDGVEFTPIGALTQAALDSGIRIWIGLHQDHEARQFPNTNEKELTDILEIRLQKIQDRLYPLMLSVLASDPNRRIFRGWYLPERLNATPEVDFPRGTVLASYLSRLGSMLERIQPDWPIMMSGGFTSPADTVPIESEEYAPYLLERWNYLLDSAGARVFLVEVKDVASAANTDEVSIVVERQNHWLQLLSDELQTETRSIGIVMPLFQPDRDDASRQSVTFSSLIDALASVRSYGREPLTVFSIPRHIMNGDDSFVRTLRRRWIQDQKACRGTPARLAGISGR